VPDRKEIGQGTGSICPIRLPGTVASTGLTTVEEGDAEGDKRTVDGTVSSKGKGTVDGTVPSMGKGTVDGTVPLRVPRTIARRAAVPAPARE
jgi:hypothetical protein